MKLLLLNKCSFKGVKNGDVVLISSGAIKRKDVMVKALSNRFIKMNFLLLILTYHIIPIFHVIFGEVIFLGKNVFIVIPAVFIVLSALFMAINYSKQWLQIVIVWVLFYICLGFVSFGLYPSFNNAIPNTSRGSSNSIS